MNGDGGIIVFMLGLYAVACLLFSIDDDTVYPQAYERAVIRCERNDGLRWLETNRGIVWNNHDVRCNDGARFKIPRYLPKEEKDND